MQVSMIIRLISLGISISALVVAIIALKESKK